MSAVAACWSRASTSSPLARESSLVSSWILRSAEARSAVGEAVMTRRAFHTICPRGFGLPMAPAIQLGRTRMLRDMVPRWNVQQAHNAPGVYGLPLVSTAHEDNGRPPALVARD